MYIFFHCLQSHHSVNFFQNIPICFRKKKKLQRLGRWSEFNGIFKNIHSSIFAKKIKIFFSKKREGVLRIYSDLMKNPNGGGTLKKKN
jgi:hypothetical protein